MSDEEILQGLYDYTLVGNKPEVIALTEQGLEANMVPTRMLFEALIPELEEVGARFERGDFCTRDADRRPRHDRGARLTTATPRRHRCRNHRHLRNGHRQGRCARHR